MALIYAMEKCIICLKRDDEWPKQTCSIEVMFFFIETLEYITECHAHYTLSVESNEAKFILTNHWTFLPKLNKFNRIEVENEVTDYFDNAKTKFWITVYKKKNV